METRNCLDCGEAIKGRADKKFCSDQCRNSYNNTLNSDSTNHIRNVNNILRKNRRVLAELNTREKTRVHKSKLIDKGFNFDYYTNTFITKAGKTYRFCYEQGFLAIEEDHYMLVLRGEYVK